MRTKDYIDMLKSSKRAPIYVAMQQALCYYLFENSVPCHLIIEATRKSKSNIYYSVTQMKDRLEVGDHIAKQAYDEIANHKIRVVPCTIDGDILSRHVGYKLLIDNVIF